MAARRIFVDKTELVLMVPGKSSVTRRTLEAKEIVRIQYDKCTETVFGIIPRASESITFVSGKWLYPLVYKKFANKNFFDAYKRELEKFANDNHVTFTDNTKE